MADLAAVPELVAGVWIPVGDSRTAEVLTAPCRANKRPIIAGKAAPQWRQVATALGLLPAGRRRTAVDVGAHVGFWTMLLVNEFDFVLAIEPQPEACACLAKNVVGVNWRMEQVLLGAEHGFADMISPPDQTNAAHVASRPMAVCRSSIDRSQWRRWSAVPVVPLDAMGIEDIDLLKIDAEGTDLDVLRGGERTVMRDKPVVVVEQVGTENALRWLIDRGAREAARIKGDVFVVW